MTDQHHDELDFDLPQAAKISRTVIGVAFGAVVAGALALAYLQHRKAHAGGALPRGDGTVGKVEVVKPNTLKSDQAMTLPGLTKALEETKIYPRTSGYVRKWLADIGDKVKEGQLLAEIETPDLDAQLAQARAQLASAGAALKQAEAQATYSKQNAIRNESMSDQKLIAKATVEQAQAQAATDAASVAANQANVVAAEANVHRLAELQNFAKVVAPFAGAITQRTIDRGSFVTDNGTTPMFVLDATDPIRVFVDVPQTVAPSVKDGTPVVVTSREYAGRSFTGEIARSSGALDPDLHTMSTEIHVPNADGALLPGMYVLATITFPVPHRVVEIPATALYNDSTGLRVATVDAQQKIHFVPITIERDLGATLWVASGLTGDERIVKIAGPSLIDGDQIEIK